jgi:hypothetical protein
MIAMLNFDLSPNLEEQPQTGVHAEPRKGSVRRLRKHAVDTTTYNAIHEMREAMRAVCAGKRREDARAEADQ